MSLGPVMVDVAGLMLTEAERQRLQHPLVGGVILFARNYASPEQLSALTAEIRAVRTPRLLIATDHEGGRVQRFREGFTVLPAMRELGVRYAQHPARALHLTQHCGYVLAAELRAHHIDLSFAPVLDIDYVRSAVIGNRAFDADPHVVGDLAHALMVGMRMAGMSAVAKHFPGHGYAEADSHHAMPVDERNLATIMQADILPYRRLIADGLPGVMPAHVRYPAVDQRPAGFSSYWLGQVLRKNLGFSGAIVSDDLSMDGAGEAGGIVARAQSALDAGCDLILVCNNPDLADQALHHIQWHAEPLGIARRAHLHGRGQPLDRIQLREQAQYVAAQHEIAGLGHDSGDLWGQDTSNSCGLSGV